MKSFFWSVFSCIRTFEYRKIRTRINSVFGNFSLSANFNINKTPAYVSILASAHVRCQTLADYMAIANKLKEFFHDEGIHSTTIQPEFIDDQDPSVKTSSCDYIIEDNSCVLECKKDCIERTCCGTITKHDTSTDSGMDMPVGSSGSGTPVLPPATEVELEFIITENPKDPVLKSDTDV